MTIPFLDLFKNVKERLFPAVRQSTPEPSRIVRVEKPSGLRLSKTVLPHVGRARTASDRFQVDAGPASAGKAAGIPAPRTISFDSPRNISGSRSSAKAAAIAPEPQTERTISLQVCDILDQLPRETIKPAESFDAARAIVLKASEIEKGMATGQPSVSLASIYQQAPEIFLNSISPADSTPVLLPFTKVLEQFANLKVRADQESEQAVPQLETPFLAVTIEDTKRFGTTVKPLEASAVPPIKVETATAQTLAAAEPEPAIREVTRLIPPPSRPAISLRDLDALGSTSVAAGASTALAEKQQHNLAPISPQKIPFHLPPNGTGVPASEKVPASSGPPVPIPSPDLKSTAANKDAPPDAPKQSEGGSPSNDPVASSPASSSPPKTARIPFKFTSPSDDIRPKFTLVPGVEPKQKTPFATKSGPTSGDTKIAVPLQALLHDVPAFQLSGSPMSVGEDVLVEFPLSLIEPQLASGRVTVAAKVFQRAIPEMHRGLFVIDQHETPVTLPLQEILRHLPSNALRMRGDQEEAVKLKQEITTPFSIQAQEDSKRFEAMAAAASKCQTPEPQAEEKKEEKENVQPSSSNPPLPLTGTAVASVQLPTEAEPDLPAGVSSKAEEIDAKQVVARAIALPGVGACAISFADGLSLAGNIPTELGADGICAMTPSVWQKIGNHMRDTKLGSFQAMTLHCAESSLTFFMEGNICLTAVHAGGVNLTHKTQEELVAIVRKLSRTYAQPELTDTGYRGKD